MKIEVNGSRYQAEQYCSHPVVYFDNWVWVDCAMNEGFKNSLVSLFKRYKATIAYSKIGLLEISKISNELGLKRVAEVMDSADYIFSESNPFKVMEKENSARSSGQVVSPNFAFDTKILKSFINEIFQDKNNPRVSDYINWLLKPGNRETIGPFDNWLSTVANPIVEEHRESNFKKAKLVLSNGNKRYARPPFTFDIFRFFISYIVEQKEMKMPESEWYDVMHAIVPLAYFDYVLLDNRWASFVNTRIKDSIPKIAKCFSKKTFDDFAFNLMHLVYKIAPEQCDRAEFL